MYILLFMLKVAPDIQYRLLGRFSNEVHESPPVMNFSVVPPREVSSRASPPATSKT